MKWKTAKKAVMLLCVFTLVFSLSTVAFAEGPDTPDEPPDTPKIKVFYPTAVTTSEDKTEIRKMYDLDPEDDPAGIPRSDFEQDGFSYTLVDLLKQELPENESRQHIETVTVDSKSKDMATVLGLLPQTKEFITEDGFIGVLELSLESINVEIAGYSKSSKSLSVTRSYPGLTDQDLSYIPKSIEDNGSTLTLNSVNWTEDASGHFTATATYTGSKTTSSVKGYTVTADYIGTVSKINLHRIRYVAIFHGEQIVEITPVKPEIPEESMHPNNPNASDEPDDPDGSGSSSTPVGTVDPDVPDVPDIPDDTTPSGATEPTTPSEPDAKGESPLVPIIIVVVVILVVGGILFIRWKKGRYN